MHPIRRGSHLPHGLKLALSLLAVALIVTVVPAYGFLSQSPGFGHSDSRAQGADSDDSLAASSSGEPEVIRMSFVGDVNLAEGWGADVAHNNGGRIDAAFSLDILQHMRSADIFYANHEFAMSDRGEALPKHYTFRADAAFVDYWSQMGVDVVGLANNHSYDYGPDAFLDTLNLLKSNGVKYVGAGMDLDEAMTPLCFTFDDYTIAFVAADRSQKGDEIRAQAAGAGTPGVLFCFDDELFLTAVANARAMADYVVAIPHWGTEMSTVLEPVQTELAYKLIDAGADAVVGSHPHILQGLEFYQGKLIAYSLGNYWFNSVPTLTAILDIEIVHGEPRFRLTPAMQGEEQVYSAEQVTTEVLGFMRELSPTVAISNDGYLSVYQ